RPHIGSCKTQHEETESQKGPHDPIPGIPRILSSILENGGMGERLKPAVLKTAVRGTVPGVRIPLPPLVINTLWTCRGEPNRDQFPICAGIVPVLRLPRFVAYCFFLMATTFLAAGCVLR